jgi:hypothetical protein
VKVAVIYLVEAGLAAARRVAPLYFGILIVAAILFGGRYAMRAADAVDSLARSTPLRLGLWTAWTVATLPAAHVLFATPSTFYLRSLPSTRVPMVAAVTLGLVAVESPWIVLHIRGGGPLVGAAAAVVAAGLHTALLAQAFVVAALLLATVAWPAPTALSLALGAAAVVFSGRAAFRSAPERTSSPERRAVAGPAPVALALAYLVSAWRSTPGAFLRAALVGLAGAALTALVARNNDAGGSLAFALAMTAPVLVLALGGIVEAVIAAEREAVWLVAATPASATVRVAARVGAVGASGLVAGAALAAVVAAAAGGGPALVVAEAVWGAALATLISSGERLAMRADERNGGLAVTFALVVAGAGATSAALLDVAALAVAVPAALLAAVLA